jgi:SAM-dependent methyltransferase
MQQSDVDRANSEFWNELCGTSLAKHLGITDHSHDCLQRFDQYYFGLYPYLLPLVKPKRMATKVVLEIGLGYGSLSQRLAEYGAVYHGLDIAPNAVRMVNNRLRMQNLPGRAFCGSALQMPFPQSFFDHVVSIGCYHHTGNVQRCLDETYRVLKPGGTAVLMVYNKYSYRQWRNHTWRTLRAALADLLAWPDWSASMDARNRAAYDANSAGEAAPETVLLSVSQLRKMLNEFQDVKFSKQNCDPLVTRNGSIVVDRTKLLSNLGRWLGLDIYFEARKGITPGVRHAA